MALHDHEPLALLQVTVTATCSISKPLVAAPWGRGSKGLCQAGTGDFSPVPAALCCGLAVIFWFPKAWYAE